MRRGRPTGRQAAAQALQARREALRKRMQRRKGERAPDKPPRWRRRLLVLLLLLLLWALFRDCSCPDDPPPEPAVGPAVGAATPPVPQAPDPPLPTEVIGHRERPGFVSEAPDPLPWVASFRMQVSARAPRLAACFVGAARPGRLKWTAAVEPVSGQVSDHTLDPTLQSDALTELQRRCVIGVLSDPPYRLDAPGAQSPSRVSMVIEF